ncbi:MAG: mechanosensitive ion channel [Paracoccaceae bacterium]|nr:mechanosensitive ion channel [Paracoccaceae bacterium]
MIRRFLRFFVTAALLTATPLAAQVALDGVATGGPEVADPTAVPAPLTDLIEVLRDEASREALIAELERAAGTAEASGPSEAAVEDIPASIGARIADITRSAAERFAAALAEIPTSFRSAQRLMQGLDAETWDVIWAAALDIALVVAVTLTAFLILRRIAVMVLRRIGAATKDAGLARKAVLFVASVIVRFAAVMGAGAIGYAVMTTALGEFGEIELNQTLFLNAFLAVELVKAAVRTLISPRAAELRAFRMTDAGARRVTRIAGVAISVLGYGLLLIVPIVDAAASFLAARSMSVLVVHLALVYLAFAVVIHRRAGAEWLTALLLAPPPAPPAEAAAPGPEAEADDAPEAGDDAPAAAAQTEAAPEAAQPEAAPAEADRTPPPREGVLAPLLQRWHWFALIWLGFIFYRAFTRSLETLGEIVLVTLQIGGVAFLGAALMGLLGRRMEAGVSLPERINAKLPALEGRLNHVVPRMLMGLRALVAIVVAGFAFDRLGLTNLGGWLETPRGIAFLATVLTVAIILLVAWGIWLAVSSWIDYRLNPDYGGEPSSREITLLTLLKNAVSVAILIFALMFTLSELGLNIGPLIASAGVLGLAIGFGAQKLVQDIITGVFIQFENAINVGDVVTVGGITGGVERLTVRSVTLRDLQGIVHIVPFSSVDMVSNFTRDFSYYVVDMGIAYREDVDEAKQALIDAHELLKEDPEQGLFVLGDLEYFGLDQFGDSAIVLKCRVKTWPGKQWGVGRAYNRLVKQVFDERGIEIPFPHQTLYFGEAKDGTVQTLPIRQVAGPPAARPETAAPPTRRSDAEAAHPTDDGPLGEDD